VVLVALPGKAQRAGGGERRIVRARCGKAGEGQRRLPREGVRGEVDGLRAGGGLGGREVQVLPDGGDHGRPRLLQQGARVRVEPGLGVPRGGARGLG
jgi:hypothetical protein